MAGLASQPGLFIRKRAFNQQVAQIRAGQHRLPERLVAAGVAAEHQAAGGAFQPIGHSGHGVMRRECGQIAVIHGKALAHGQRPPLQPWRFCAGQLAEIRPDLPVEDVLAQAVQRGGQAMHLQWARACRPHRIHQQRQQGHMIQMGVTEKHMVNRRHFCQRQRAQAGAGVNQRVRAQLQAGGMPGAADAAIAAQDGEFHAGDSFGCLSIMRRTGYSVWPVLCGGMPGGARPTPPQGQGLRVDGLGVLRGQKRTANQTGLIACSAHPVGGGAHGAEWREPHARRESDGIVHKKSPPSKAGPTLKGNATRRRTSRSPPAASWPISWWA